MIAAVIGAQNTVVDIDSNENFQNIDYFLLGRIFRILLHAC